MRGPLDGVHVLDLTDEVGIYCAKLLRELGAYVVRVETGHPGSLSRVLPWVSFSDGGCLSTYWLYMNEGKEVLQLADEPDAVRRAIEDLAPWVDIIIESRRYGPSAGIISYEDLRQKKPELIYVLITPFGSSGPKASWKGSDLVCLAAGGLLWLSGEPGRAPLPLWGEQAFWAAGAAGALGALGAYYVRLRYGFGQRVEVSVQEVVATALENAVQYLDLQGVMRRRCGSVGDVHRVAGVGFYPCRDGWIYLHAGLEERHWLSLARWLGDAGLEEADVLSQRPWTELSYRRTEGARQEFDRMFARISVTRGKQDLFEEGQRYRVPIAPVNTPLEVLRDPHLQEREFFEVLQFAERGGSYLFPGPPFRFSAAARGNRRRLSLSSARSDWSVLREQLVGGNPLTLAPSRKSEGQRTYGSPLAGVRIVDFAWVGAGPLATRLLACLGAQVIRVETSIRPDPLRLLPPFKQGIPGMNRSGYFNDRNAGKLSICLNLNHRGAVEVARRLIRVSDVVINSFRPGTMARWGLDYESVRALRPDIIYVDMPYAGVSGKYRTYGGYGLSLAALSGFAYLTAYDETEPMGTGTNYPDHVPNPYHAAVAILAALCHRCKTGRGQYVEVSQLESTLAFLGPALLWSSFTGENPPPSGKGREDALIYGVFQCRGTDRWVAISVFTDDEWRGLVKAMGSPGWSNDPRFADHESRISCRAELADRVQAWVRHFEAEEVAEVLQAHGVAAAVVENAADLLADSHLAMRNFWKRLDHPETGPAVYTGFPICFELTPGEVRSAAPSLGEHTEFICREILAMDDAEITKLKEEGALR